MVFPSPISSAGSTPLARGAKGKKSGFDLVGVELDGVVEENTDQTVNARAADAAQFVGVAFGVVRGEHFPG